MEEGEGQPGWIDEYAYLGGGGGDVANTNVRYH